MYPVIRMAKQMFVHRNDPPLPFTGTHVSRHRCWPWDIDLWMELNNGRTLTLLDLGRIPLIKRIGLFGVLKSENWGMTIAGVAMRYRRRIRAFEQFETRGRVLCWDERFLYIEQSMWKQDGECANNAVFRVAVTGPSGIMPPQEVRAVMGGEKQSPEVPEWVAKWIDAEALRPWPPMQD